MTKYRQRLEDLFSLAQGLLSLRYRASVVAVFFEELLGSSSPVGDGGLLLEKRRNYA